MNASILCTLLAQRIPPEQFQLWGTDVHWMDESFDTPENKAIVADVIKNYDKLAGDVEKDIKEDKEKESLIQAKIRAIAVEQLIKENKLTVAGKIVDAA